MKENIFGGFLTVEPLVPNRAESVTERSALFPVGWLLL